MSETPKNDPIVPTDLPGNSYSNRKVVKKDTTSKAEDTRPDPKPIVTGEVFRKKRGMGSKFRESLTGDDSKTVLDYIVFEVLVPSLKNMLFDAGKETLERSLYGSVGRGGTRTNQGAQRQTNYGKMYSHQNSRTTPPLSARARAQHEFDNIVLDDRQDAENVLESLYQLVEQYGSARVSDLYGLIGQSHNYVDQNWGWTDLRTATTQQVRGGCLLDLPQPVPLK